MRPGYCYGFCHQNVAIYTLYDTLHPETTSSPFSSPCSDLRQLRRAFTSSVEKLAVLWIKRKRYGSPAGSLIQASISTHAAPHGVLIDPGICALFWRWEVLSSCFGNRDQVGQHPLACLKAPCSRSNYCHRSLRIGLDVDGIEQPINPGQWIAQRKGYGLDARF